MLSSKYGDIIAKVHSHNTSLDHLRKKVDMIEEESEKREEDFEELESVAAGRTNVRSTVYPKQITII